MKISKQARRGAKQLYVGCVVNGVLDENRVRSAVQQVTTTKPRGYLPTLVHFQRLVRLEIMRRTATVESAVALPGDLRASVQEKLGGLYGAGLSTQFAENADLIGGLRIKVGSDVYDGSVQARLKGLKENF